MRAGEQLAAMEMMGVDPVRRIIVPRFLGTVISMPILALIFSAIGVIGAWIVGVELIGCDNGAFWSQMQDGVDVITMFSMVFSSPLSSVSQWGSSHYFKALILVLHPMGFLGRQHGRLW